MLLSSEETILLTNFLTNHGIVEYVFPADKPNQVSNLLTWLNTMPNVNDYNDNDPYTGIKQVLYGLSFTEKKNIFAYDNVTHWYRQVLTDISNGSITDKDVKKYIDVFSQKSNNASLLTLAFNEFLARVVKSQDVEFLQQIFYIMVKQGLMSEASLNRIIIEFMPNPRYSSIGLSLLPDTIELASILNNL